MKRSFPRGIEERKQKMKLLIGLIIGALSITVGFNMVLLAQTNSWIAAIPMVSSWVGYLLFGYYFIRKGKLK